MIPIKAYSIGDAHQQILSKLLIKGKVQMTQDGEFTLELLDMVIDIQHPLDEPMVHPGSNFQGGKLQAYVDGLINGTEGEFTYDYHGRLFQWGRMEMSDLDDLGVDQPSELLGYLSAKENRDSRRAVMITWYPWKDLGYSGPCLQYVQLVIRDGAVHMTVLFRSNDGLSAAGANMFALVGLQSWFAARLGVAVGSYCHHSVSMHAYVLRDQKEVEDMLMKENGWTRDVARARLVNQRPDVPWKV